MTTQIDRAAHDKVIRARTNLLVSNGFFGFLAMQLRIVQAKVLPGGMQNHTMAVDGVRIYYNPDFVHKMDDREVEGVLAHEVMHCCFQHFVRRGDRHPFVWNMAGDHVINLDLLESGFTLPTPHLADPKYKGMNTEEVYDLIYDECEKIYIKQKGSGDGEGNPDPGGCGGVIDSPGQAGDKEAVKQEWETAVRTAVQVAKQNNVGNVPGSLRRLIADLQKPKVSWRDLTRNFIDQSMSKDVSWSRISRRSVSIGALMPGYVADRMRQLVFVVDTSGSINERMLNEFLSEVAGALDQGVADGLLVVYADTRVHDVDDYVPGDLVKARSLENGGGGTDFADSFNWIKDNAPDASCVIYLTDLEVYNFGEDPGCPMLWAVYTHSSEHFDELASKAPFGTAIHVSNSIG